MTTKTLRLFYFINTYILQCLLLQMFGFNSNFQIIFNVLLILNKLFI